MDRKVSFTDWDVGGIAQAVQWMATTTQARRLVLCGFLDGGSRREENIAAEGAIVSMVLVSGRQVEDQQVLVRSGVLQGNVASFVAEQAGAHLVVSLCTVFLSRVLVTLAL